MKINAMLRKRMSLEEIRTSKRAEGSDHPRHEPVDGFLRSKGIRFLEATEVCLTADRAEAAIGPSSAD
jgi:hypothetical protein